MRAMRVAGVLDARGKRRAGGGAEGNEWARKSFGDITWIRGKFGAEFSLGFIGVVSLFSIFKLLRSRAPNENQIYSAQEYSVY